MKDAIKMMESNMGKESMEQARLLAEQEILTIRLAQLRERLGIKQTDFSRFSQTSISRLEKRKDIRVSTLIEYLRSMGLGLEIRTYPQKKTHKMGEEILLRV